MKSSSRLAEVTFVVSLLLTTHFALAQDTLRYHYENSTVSQAIPIENGSGFITGKGSDGSTGKFMIFNSYEHRSPSASLDYILLDLEVSNYSELDSFTLRAFPTPNSAPIAGQPLEEKYAFSDVSSTSTPIAGIPNAAYNFVAGPFYDIAVLGSIELYIGISYDNSTNSSIALKATGDGEFDDAINRTFTEEADGMMVDFKTKYDKDVALAIFPVMSIFVGQETIEENMFEVLSGEANYFTVIYEGESNLESQIGLYDMSGRLVNQYALGLETQTRISTNHLPKGIYLLELTQGNRRGIQKVVVK